MHRLFHRQFTIYALALVLSYLLLRAVPITQPLAAQGNPIRHVPAQYATIAAALAAAQAGDTVQVAAGVYNEGMLTLPPQVTLVGSGRDDTIIHGHGQTVVLYPKADSTVRDLTVRGSTTGDFSAGIWISEGTVTIANTRITDNATGVWAWCFEPATCNIAVTLTGNLIVGNRDNGVNSNEYAVFNVSQNTIADNGGASIILNHAASQVQANLVANNGGAGILNRAEATVVQNNSWGNQSNFVGKNSDSLQLDPLFRNAAAGDYQLAAGSPLVTMQTEATMTLGALPFIPTGAPPAEVTVTAAGEGRWQVAWHEQAGAGYRLYYGSCTRASTTVKTLGKAQTHQLTNLSAAEVGYVAVSTYTAHQTESAVQLAVGITGACPAAPTDLMVGAFPNQQFRLQWQDNASNESGFEIERAEGILNTITPGTYTTIATIPANQTVYTDTPPLLETTYWYRVRAVNANGVSPYSDQSYSATFAQVPNLDERYLHVLINEARAAPEAFGYADIAPVPPVAYSAQLSYATRAHSQAILNSSFQIGHCDPVGRCPGERAAAVGYIGGGAENLIEGQTGPEAVESAHQAFMNTGGHRDNLLCPCTQEIGLGHTYDPNKAGERPFKGQYTEQFAERRDRVLPNLPSGIVIPYRSDWQSAFTFIVNYYHAEGQVPTEARVYIDDQPNAMTLSTGQPAHGTYRLTTQLAPGTHTYYFVFTFAGGSAQLPATGGYTMSVTGPATFTAGDGNGDGSVTAADIEACVQEIFDGDGSQRGQAYQGRLAGTAGCDANGNDSIDAADLSCIVQIIATGSCQEASAAGVTTAAALTIGPPAQDGAGNTTVPIALTTGGQASSALAFAVRPGPSFVTDDQNGDGIPDGVQLVNGQAGITTIMTWADDRLAVVLLDTELPIQTLADGQLLTLTLQDADGSGVTFDQAVPASLGSPTGANVPITQPTAANLIFLPVVVR